MTSVPSLPFSANQADSFPPDLITLSQVEDLVAMHKMIQALHVRTPPPCPFPILHYGA